MAIPSLAERLNQAQITPALGIGLGLRRTRQGTTLDVLYPQIFWQQQAPICQALQLLTDTPAGHSGFVSLNAEQLHSLTEWLESSTAEPTLKALVKQLHQAATQPAPGYAQLDAGVFFLAEAHQTVSSPEEAYFKLQLISQRHVQPHGVTLDGAFKVLTNLAWTNQGPILLEELEQQRIAALLSGSPLVVSHVDKFPYLVNYHVPEGTRIAAGSQVRLGAYLGDGTTVMPAGYVNFNAGTQGNAMVEGRISAGVVVGSNTDIGGGASIMGTLSGGNKHVISLGEKCLLGANAGTGISLGDGCTIAAGLYITGGTKVALYNLENQPINLEGQVVEAGEHLVKARDLSGRSHLLFIQDSLTGEVQAKPNPRTIELNMELHKHN